LDAVHVQRIAVIEVAAKWIIGLKHRLPPIPSLQPQPVTFDFTEHKPVAIGNAALRYVRFQNSPLPLRSFNRKRSPAFSAEVPAQLHRAFFRTTKDKSRNSVLDMV
jgi:hypothetical protein